MAQTSQQRSDLIDKAQQKLAELISAIVDKEGKGECPDDLYSDVRVLSSGIQALDSDNGNLTSEEVDAIMSCLNAIGKLSSLSVAGLLFAQVVILKTMGTYLSLSDTETSYSGKAGQWPVVNGAETGLVFEKAGFGPNTLIVAPDGDDSSAQKGNIARRYSTLAGAQSAAINGDRIIVSPGGYNIGSSSLGKNGVDWIFLPGAAVVNDPSTGEAIWDVSGGSAISFAVRGYGYFFQKRLGKPVVNFDQGSSQVYLWGRYQHDAGDPTSHGVTKGDGILKLEDCTIYLDDRDAFAVNATSSGKEIYINKAESNANLHDPDIVYRVNNILLSSFVI